MTGIGRRLCRHEYVGEQREGGPLATGRGIQLTKQVGEYLVAAELCRRGLTATTFTGNVPDYDIVAVSETGKHVLIQVKATLRGAWQFSDARAFLDIKLNGKAQIPGRLKPPKYDDLVFVFVRLATYGEDRFFMLTWIELRNLIADHYRANLKHLGGVRPRKHDSYHAALEIKNLKQYENRWELIADTLGSPAA